MLICAIVAGRGGSGGSGQSWGSSNRSACLAVFKVDGSPELQNKKSIFVELEESEEIVTVNDLMKKASPGKLR